MRRRFAILALLAVVAHWQGAFAQQISVPELTPLGQPIVASVTGLPDGARIAWKADAGASVINAGLGKAHVWGVAGAHTLTAVAAPEDGDLIWLEAPFAVGDAPPVPPGPVVKTLAQLAGDKAPALSAMYAEFATALNGDLFTDVAHFRRTEASALVGRNLKGHGATAAIAKRLDVGTLDELKAAVAKVVEELGAGPVPPVPPVIEGNRRVVVLHETADNTPDFAQLIVKLRRADVDAYLQSKGHRLDILDDDQVDSNGQPDATVVKLKALGVGPPALFILDAATGEVVHKQPMPATVDAVLEALKSHGG